MDRNVLLFMIILGVCCAVIIETIQPTRADSWLGVTHCYGETGFTGTGNFKIDHVEWRVIWVVTQSSNAEFRMEIFEDKKGESFASIYRTGENDSGIFYVNEHTADSNQYLDSSNGTFHVDVLISGWGFYSLLVEENLDSIPEYPSFIIIPLLMTITLTMMLSNSVQKRFQRAR